jgi:signal transduction histidine kinase
MGKAKDGRTFMIASPSNWQALHISEKSGKKIAAKSFDEAHDANEIVKLIDDAITQTKGLSRGLHPVRLEASGLMTALSELAATVEKLFMITCRFEYDKPVLINDNLTAIHLYRIAQEAVNNAIKHGMARNITISFHTDNNETALTIRNDGRGFRKVTRREWV